MTGMNYGYTDPTQRNSVYLKEFLKKPMTVILAIVYSILGIFGFISFIDSAEVFDKSMEFIAEESVLLALLMYVIRFSQVLFPVLLAIGFFVIFAQSQSRDKDITPKAGLKAFLSGAITATICYITTVLLLLYVIYEVLDTINKFSRVSSSQSAELTGMILGILIGAGLIITYATSFTGFALSVYRSATTPHLYKNSSVTFAVMNFIIATFSFFSLSSAQEQLGDYGALLSQNSELNLITLLTIATYILCGIFALLYRSHITDAGPDGVNIPGQLPQIPIQSYPVYPGYPGAANQPYNPYAQNSYGAPTSAPYNTAPANIPVSPTTSHAQENTSLTDSSVKTTVVPESSVTDNAMSRESETATPEPVAVREESPSAETPLSDASEPAVSEPAVIAAPSEPESFTAATPAEPLVSQVTEPTVSEAPEKPAAPEATMPSASEALTAPAVTTDETSAPSFCFNCGSPVKGNGNFCGKCGTKLR